MSFTPEDAMLSAVAQLAIGYWLFSLPLGLPNPLWRNLDIGARINPTRAIRSSPADAVSDNLDYLRLAIGRKCLVARAKIEDFSGATPPTAARSKDFSALEPGNENQLIWVRDTERLRIHFLVRDLKVGR